MPNPINSRIRCDDDVVVVLCETSKINTTAMKMMNANEVWLFNRSIAAEEV